MLYLDLETLSLTGLSHIKLPSYSLPTLFVLFLDHKINLFILKLYLDAFCRPYFNPLNHSEKRVRQVTLAVEKKIKLESPQSFLYPYHRCKCNN